MIDWWWVGHVGAIAAGVFVGNMLTDLVQRGASNFYWKVWTKRKFVGFKP